LSKDDIRVTILIDSSDYSCISLTMLSFLNVGDTLCKYCYDNGWQYESISWNVARV